MTLQRVLSNWLRLGQHYILTIFRDSAWMGWRAILCHVHQRAPLLDPRLLVVQVPEELVQTVRLVEFGAAAGGHALDLAEAAVDSVALVLHLGGVEGVAGHQAVSLAIQILQTILWRRKDARKNSQQIRYKIDRSIMYKKHLTAIMCHRILYHCHISVAKFQ